MIGMSFFVTDREQVRKVRNRVVVSFLLRRESDRKKDWKKGWDWF